MKTLLFKGLLREFIRKKGFLSWIAALSLFVGIGISPTYAGIKKNIPGSPKGHIANMEAQSLRVTGKITDENGNPMPGANIFEKGTGNGVVTDIDGKYSIDVPSDAVLVISFVGYVTEDIPVDSRNVIDITLIPDIANLQEIVVVGYGTQKKATVTGSVSTVDEEVFKNRGAMSNPLAALQGQVAGVIVTRSSAAPGQEGWSFQVRGATSNGTTEPLVIVDGVPMSGVSDLNSINPNDISNISFLKDGSAAIYGARAAGGVVLITTKKAKVGEPVIEYSGTFSYKKMGLTPSFLSPDEYGEYLYQAIANASANGEPDENWIWTKYARAWMNRPESGYIDKTVDGYVDEIGFSDVMDYTFFDTNPIAILWGDGDAFSTQHDISLSARTENLGYRLSLGYMDDGSMLEWGKNSNKRYNARIALDFIPTDKLNISTNVSFEKNDLVVPTRQEVINYGSQPGFPVATINGKPYAWGTQPSRNWLLELGGEEIKLNNHLFSNVKVEYDILKNLKLVAQACYNWSSTDRSEHYKSIPEIYNYAETYQYQANPSIDQAWYERSATNNVFYNTFSYLEYSKVFNNVHRFSLMAGGSYERNEYKYFSTTTTYLPSNEIPAVNLSLLSDVDRSTNNEDRTHWALASGFGRLNYALKDKYLLEVNARYDGTSRFDPDHRWKFYPGVSAGWRLSEENFMENISFLNELKMRGSIGTVGNQNSSEIGLYDYIQTVGMDANGPILGPYSSRVVTAYPSSTLVSLERTWETIKTSNIGIDFLVLNNKLSGSFDYFWKENKDMLLSQKYPEILGATAPKANIGHLKTWGWETTLGWKDNIGQISYRISGTLTDNNNKLVSYQTDTRITAGKWDIEGYALGSYFGLEYDGRVQTEEDAEAYADYIQGNTIGMSQVKSEVIQGINMYKDVNGDGKLTNNGADEYTLAKVDSLGNPVGDGDIVYLGRSDPRYVFAVNLGLNWKGFDFTAIFQGVGKRTIFRDADWSKPFGTIWQGHADWWVGETWTPDNPDAKLPILTTATNNGYGSYTAYNYQISDWSVQSGAYIRLKNVVIGYTLPGNILKKINIDNLRVYLSGNDICEFTKIRDGWDPEQTPQVTAGAQRYPFFRMYTLGVNVTF